MLSRSGRSSTYYVSFSRLIDARLHGERERTLPRVYARPLALRQGQAIGQQELISRLNDLGYAQRAEAEVAGEFSIAEHDASQSSRDSPSFDGRVVRISFTQRTPSIRRIEVEGKGATATVELDAPLLTALMTSGDREKRRSVPLATIPIYAQQAVLAIEDQGFYSHPGINPFRMIAAVVTNVFGDNPNLVGYSTITQQLARMFFLSDEFNAELHGRADDRTCGRCAKRSCRSSSSGGRRRTRSSSCISTTSTWDSAARLPFMALPRRRDSSSARTSPI